MTSITPGRSAPLARPSPRHGLGSAAGLAAAGIGGLVLAALANEAAARAAERHYPPRGRFLEIDGVRLHYLDRGQGPAIVLLHGNGAMAEDMQASGLLDALAERHRVIAFDRPGFGYSTRPRGQRWTARRQAGLIASAIRRLGLDRVLVVGHSWGTLVALGLGIDHRPLVGGLVLLSGYYFPTPHPMVPLFTPPAIPVLGDVMRYTISPISGRLLAPLVVRRLFEPAPVAPRFTAAFPLDLALRPGQIRALAADTALMRPSAAALAPFYPSLVCPVTIVAGDGDRVVAFDEQAARLHAVIPQSRLVRIGGAGHMIHYTAPSAVAEAIRTAAEGLSPLA